MDDASVVRGSQPFCDLQRVFDCLARRQGTVRKLYTQRSAFKKF